MGKNDILVGALVGAAALLVVGGAVYIIKKDKHEPHRSTVFVPRPIPVPTYPIRTPHPAVFPMDRRDRGGRRFHH